MPKARRTPAAPKVTRRRRARRAPRTPAQVLLHPKAYYELILESEGMPAELDDLPTSWTVYDPTGDGRVVGDRLDRERGREAHRQAVTGAATRDHYSQVEPILHDKTLTRRARDVVELYCEGLGRVSIAKRLDITEGAVREVFRKLRKRYAIPSLPSRPHWRKGRTRGGQG